MSEVVGAIVASLKRLRIRASCGALAVVCLSAAVCTGAEESMDVSAYFPDLAGWTKDGAPIVYDAETLYEYIDGAADLYVNYDFQELGSLYYERGEDQGIAVDVYRHSTPRNAFGIYSQERPAEGGFIDVGTQGYYDAGILNFLLGPYYVKLSGYSLGEEDEAILKSVAKDVASRLGADPGLPKVLSAFPDSGKVAGSEKYIATSFMGHGFLRCAFVADYKARKQEFQLLIIEADGESEAEGMVKSYIKLAKDKGQPVESDGAFTRLKDPYQGPKGAVNLMAHGRYVWGMLGDDPALYDYYLKAVEDGLKKAGLF